MSIKFRYKASTSQNYKKCIESLLIGSYAFNQDCWLVLIYVDHILFKEFCGALQPIFKEISRNTVKGDIIRMYKEEKLKSITFISKNQSRFAITIDM
ncbi:hypothetical protein Lal_00022760 [Lupinus albus]|nr:hypothetical protein Lal_00022760 [Lupinus albus]